jgi:hypothetical protein
MDDAACHYVFVLHTFTNRIKGQRNVFISFLLLSKEIDLDVLKNFVERNIQYNLQSALSNVIGTRGKARNPGISKNLWVLSLKVLRCNTITRRSLTLE